MDTQHITPKSDKKAVEDFLGMRLLTPLEEVVVGGAGTTQGDHHDGDSVLGHQHDHQTVQTVHGG